MAQNYEFSRMRTQFLLCQSHCNCNRNCNTPLRLTASFRKLFKIISNEILEAKFGFITQTIAYPQVFMLLAVVVLGLWRRKVWKSVRDLTVKMTWAVKFHPKRFVTVKSLINL